MTRPQSVVGRETLHWIIAAAAEFAGVAERTLCFRRLHSARLQEGIAIGGLQLQPALPRRGGALHFLGLGEHGEQCLRFTDLGKFWRR